MGVAAVFLDQQVDRLGGSVRGAAGVEVGEELPAPGAQGPPEPGHLGDGAGRQGGEKVLGAASWLFEGGRVVDLPRMGGYGIGLTSSALRGMHLSFGRSISTYETFF